MRKRLPTKSAGEKDVLLKNYDFSGSVEVTRLKRDDNTGCGEKSIPVRFFAVSLVSLGI